MKHFSKKALICLTVVIMMILSGCQTSSGIVSTEENDVKASTETTILNETSEDVRENETEAETEAKVKEESIIPDELSELFTERDLLGEYDTKGASLITLSDKDVSITKEGVYIISGSMKNSAITVNAPDTDKVQIVLDNVNISNEKGPSIYVKSADKVFITIPEDTSSSLENGGSFETIDENNIDSVIFSKSDLVINGTGELEISSPAAHGIVSKDDLKVCGTNIQVDSGSSAIDGKDSLRISGGTFTITSGADCLKSSNEEDEDKGYIFIFDGSFILESADDGIYAENGITILGGEYTISSKDDSVHAGGNLSIAGGTFTIDSGDDGFHSDETLEISDGNINILTSYEGLEGAVVNISGGNITLNSSDDGVNAAGGNDSSGMRQGWFGMMDGFGGEASSDYSINISGGILRINAEGDGLDSNGTIVISGGETYVDGPTNNGNGALDYGLSAEIHGGTVIAIGASGMAETFGDNSTQCSIMLNGNNYGAGTEINLIDSSGNTIISMTSEKTFNSVVLSCPNIVQGSTYTVQIGSDLTEVTVSSVVYSNGNGNGMGGGFGNMHDNRGGGDRNNRGGMTFPGGDNGGTTPPGDSGGDPPQGNPGGTV